MKLLKSMIVMMFAVCSLVSYSWAQGACMVSRLDGQALLFRDKDAPCPINKFKKLWPGDQVELPKDSMLQLNFLGLGRVEIWKGPARVLIETLGGRDQLNSQQPTIQNLGNLTADLRGSKLLNQQNVAGHVLVRGGRAPSAQDKPLSQAEQEQLQSVQRNYSTLVAQNTNSDDVSADLYYLAALESLEQKATMARHIRELLRIQANNADLESLLNSL